MKAAPFAYLPARTVGEAVEALGAPEAKLLAGGQSLVPMMVMRLARPGLLVDLNTTAELDFLDLGADYLEVGAMVRQRRLELSAKARSVPILPAGLAHVGHREIRNRGTVGGSLAHADPAAELPCVAALVGARLVLKSIRGTREVEASSFVTGSFQTVIEDDEVLFSVRFPLPGDGTGFAFREVARRHGDFALCGAAALATPPTDDSPRTRLALFGVADRPLVLDAHDVVGNEPNPDFEEVVRSWIDGLEFTEDIHASSAYRARLARVMGSRCLSEAWAASRTGE